MNDVFFSSWAVLARTVLLGVLAYVSLLVLLRISGKRTLSKMNAFDLIVTVALGSTLASVLVSRNVDLVQGVAAFALLIVCQFIITWLSVRSHRVRAIVKAEPRLLVHRGELLHDALRDERVTNDEIDAAVRAQGLASVRDAREVVLETDGSFSVVPERASGADAES